MDRDLKLWAAVAFVLGAAMTGRAAQLLASEALPPSQLKALPQVIATGLLLSILALSVWAARRKIEARFAAGDASTSGIPAAGRPYLTLFLASFAVLFLEVMLIRYTSSQIRIFAFYKNVPLVSCFLGLGLGCCLGGGRSRHALAFLLGLVPLAAFLAQGSALISGDLGTWVALGSSEHVLGDTVAEEVSAADMWTSQLFMGAFCVAMLVAITLLFVLLGRLLGAAFEGLPRLRAYTVNILGSLAGIMAFVGLSYLQTPPWMWFLLGLGPLLWWVTPDARIFAAALVVLNVAVVTPDYGETVWSPYQKLVGLEIPQGPGGTDRPAYMLKISDVFYQIAVDLRPENLAWLGSNPFPHYDGAFRGISPLGRVLVVGAGTGNDVAAALRAGASRVDAVDIDPAILALGRQHHPEAPYSDPRVHLIVDDARRAFHRLEPGAYHAVVFGLLDSHTQLGISSVRLDNYVFTRESFQAAARLLEPGGHFIVTAASFRDWFRQRLAAMVEEVCGPVRVEVYGAWWKYSCQLDAARPDPAAAGPVAGYEAQALPSDDWPFLYLPARGVPRAYLIVLGLLMVASVAILKTAGLELGQITPFNRHLFFLGAAFLLMEVSAINRLALLFGTTWLVSALTIGLVLALIVCANITVGLVGRIPYGWAYGGCFATLLLSYFLEPASALSRGPGYALAYGLLLLSPIYFAALIFARSFQASSRPGVAIGFNILGAVVGGWAEYATMATGIRAMVLLALVFYLLSLLALLGWRRQA